jgi:hypothetical protein
MKGDFQVVPTTTETNVPRVPRARRVIQIMPAEPGWRVALTEYVSKGPAEPSRFVMHERAVIGWALYEDGLIVDGEPDYGIAEDNPPPHVRDTAVSALILDDGDPALAADLRYPTCSQYCYLAPGDELTDDETRKACEAADRELAQWRAKRGIRHEITAA